MFRKLTSFAVGKQFKVFCIKLNVGIIEHLQYQSQEYVKSFPKST